MTKSFYALACASLILLGGTIASARSFTIPTGSGPGGVVNTEHPDGFTTRGRCQAALVHEINLQRMNAEDRNSQHLSDSTSQFQLFMLARFDCYEVSADSWKVIVYDN